MQLLVYKALNINRLPAYLLDKSGTDFDAIQAQKEDPGDTDKGKKLVCHLCQAVITTHHEQVSVLGRHIHSKINPAGFAYHFACYSSAPGCLLIGEPSAEHTWFNGFVWQIASCGQCLEHLGWMFEGDTQFYGLIQGRIVEHGSG